MKKYNVAILGATGAVGAEFFETYRGKKLSVCRITPAGF